MPREPSDFPGRVELASNPGPPAGRPKAPPEEMEIKIKRAKEIIGGQVRPPEMPTPAAVMAFLKHEMSGWREPAKPEAVKQITNWLNLQARYGGSPVACFTTKEGDLAVLAVGPEEIDALFEGLSREERAQVVVEHPDPQAEVNGPS